MVSQLGHVTICWCGVATAYVICLGLFKLVTREACDRDWGLLKFAFATLGLMQIASMMSEHEDIMDKSMVDINYGIAATVASAAAIRAYMKYVQGPEPEKVSMDGKVVIITGSNTGVGFETAKSLVSMGAHVIMACRSEAKAQAAIADIIQMLEITAAAVRHSTQPPVPGKMTFMMLDLSSLESVRAFVAEFKASKLPLDSLILNAGVMHSKRTLTKDGLEANLAVNYLGHFLLTTQLLPVLKESSDARILCVNSSLHRSPKAFRFEDPMFEKDYALFKAYANSKLALMMFAEELQQRLVKEKSKVIINSVNPGIVMTDISRNMNIFMRAGNAAVRPALALVCKQPRAGAYSSVYAATTRSLRKSGDGSADGIGGLYMQDSEPIKYNPAVDVEKSRRALWKLSEELVTVGTKKKR